MLLGSRSRPFTLVLSTTSSKVTSRRRSRSYVVRSRLCGAIPSPADSAPCGSKSTSSTRRPNSASAAPRLIVDVVLPTPPFWLHRARTRAGPCRSSGSGVTSVRFARDRAGSGEALSAAAAAAAGSAGCSTATSVGPSTGSAVGWSAGDSARNKAGSGSGVMSLGVVTGCRSPAFAGHRGREMVVRPSWSADGSTGLDATATTVHHSASTPQPAGRVGGARGLAPQPAPLIARGGARRRKPRAARRPSPGCRSGSS